MTMSALSRQIDLFETLGLSPPSSSAVRPAKTSAQPTPRAKASKASVPASSSRPSVSSEKSALVGSLLKTALISELGALTPCSLRWRESATPAGRSWFVLQTLEQTTSDPAPGSSGATLHRLPTPMASDGMKDGAGGGSGSTYPFRRILATPRKTDADRGFRGDVLAQIQGQNNRHAGMLPTPVKPNGGRRLTKEAVETGKRANGKKAQIDTPNMLHHAMAMLHTPTTKANMHHPSMQKWPSCEGWGAIANPERLPTPTKRDKRMDAWSPAYDKRKSPTMDAVLDGAMTDRASDKWVYARQIASLLSSTGLTGPSMTLPVTYGWMMGFPPGWLSNALRSAVLAGRLPLASSSKRSATP